MLTTVAGLVSFPILTRALDVQDYGLMSLIASALAFAVGLGKLGMSQATMRFYADTQAGRIAGVLPTQFVPTTIFGMGALGLLATLVWMLLALLIPTSAWSDPRMGTLMLVASSLVLARVLQSGLTNLLRAREQSGLLALLSVLHRYFSLALVMGAIFLVAPTLWSFYGATVVAELVFLVVLLFWALKGENMRPGAVSPPLLRDMLRFAWPMAGYELASVLLHLGDRYVQQTFLNAEAVGLYSAAYNLCDYVRLAVFTSMAGAAMPMLLRLASQEGDAACAAFLTRFTRIYVFVGLAVVAALCAVRGELIVVLASAKYLPGADVVPFLILGMLFEAYFSLAGIGLYLRKKSVISMCILAGGAVLNMGLNLLLVPRMGIIGSAVGNLVSCALIALVAMLATRRRLVLPHQGLTFLKFAAIAAVSAGVGLQLDAGHPALTLVARGALVLLMYGGLGVALDADLRLTARTALARWRPQAA